MPTGANFKVTNGRVLWYQSLISGDELLIQDHEHRAHARQGSYIPYEQYGNPFVETISSEISQTERYMRLSADMKECTLQDPRFVDCIVDQNSIVEEENTLTFDYQIIKADGGSLISEFTSDSA